MRIRGVQVGQVLNVKPSLERVDVLCEVWGGCGEDLRLCLGQNESCGCALRGVEKDAALSCLGQVGRRFDRAITVDELVKMALV